MSVGGELRLGDSQRVIRGEIAFPRGKDSRNEMAVCGRPFNVSS